ncbi:tRNA dimethylallyltransferase 9-like isoform X2 [Prosopis cineraria]|uniref:tRNA dimethylallyltransferase 9-like isoform X2 n=1 Tax=Prosopis cineraria TaxID=364024 RepID=UPI00240F4017|nr:tRNA dimethylallyltransferase 9-like isoform X2 [Prosopis cineraria]
MVNCMVHSLGTCCPPRRLLFSPSLFSFTLRYRCIVFPAPAVSGTYKKETKEKVIVISGPTGAGKSRLAFELTKRLNGEIVSADSVQEVKHHLIDILHPSKDYSAGNFFEDARQATRCILDNDRVPIVVGGTGLYLRWFIYGKPDVPKASPDVKSELYSELAELQKNEDWDAAVQLVVNAGDLKAQTLAVNDWYRLQRSLEIIKSSGSPPSAFRVPYDSFRGQGGYSDTNGFESSDVNISGDSMEDPMFSDLPYEFICFFLSRQRLELYKRIDQRCEDMLLGRDGILSEAQWLLKLGLHPNSNSATRAIGYRQAMEYLLRCQQHGGQSSAEEFYNFLSEFQKETRNFAKRQLTWFRNEQIYHWLDASKPLNEIIEFINNAYRDWSGNRIVPECLGMSRDIPNRQEAAQLKSYRPKNRHFIKDEDCSHILEWIRTEE